jgi:hypothetical protein
MYSCKEFPVQISCRVVLLPFHSQIVNAMMHTEVLARTEVRTRIVKALSNMHDPGNNTTPSNLCAP